MILFFILFLGRSFSGSGFIKRKILSLEMTGKARTKGEKQYKCNLCGFSYNEKQWAEKCQRWCSQHHSCNLSITRHAIP